MSDGNFGKATWITVIVGIALVVGVLDGCDDDDDDGGGGVGGFIGRSHHGDGGSYRGGGPGFGK